VYAAAGIGKTRLVSHLAAQVTRPEGLFLGHWVRQSRVLILDADDPGGFGYQLWLNRFLASHYDTDRTLIDLRNITGGLTPEDIETLKADLKDDPPRLIVLDTFASAFIGLDIIRAHHVQAALTGLTTLAKDLHCCVLCLDHVGKLRPGETVVSKGPYGAAKTFSPRAVYALSRVPPKEVEGRDVLRMDCTKLSYAPELPPIGFEITLEQNDDIARTRLVDLPHETLLDDAKAAILTALKTAQGEPMPRKALLSAAVSAVNVTERYAAKALKELERDLGKQLRDIDLGGRGNPKGYVLGDMSSSNSEIADEDSELFDEQPSSSNQDETSEWAVRL
ncbi:MAG: AAA family ATPase, partial [Deinococcota bacterium]|nr:AAA family ATPase [Deinococcota bacterium]